MNMWTSGLKRKNVCAPNKHSRESLFCQSGELQGSTTLEAAIIMPLFIYAVTAVLYMLQIIMVKQDMNMAMYNTVRTMSKYAYVYDKVSDSSEKVSAITAYGTLLAELGLDYAKEHYIVGGNAGIVVVGTKVMDGDGQISLKVTYGVKNPFDIWGIGVVGISQTYSSQGWIGDEGVAEKLKNEKEEQGVYITLYGEVYHTDQECAYINLSVTSIMISELSRARNYNGGRFYACEICMDDSGGFMPQTLYITHYGDRYHKSEDCSGIKRTVIKVPLSEAKGRRPCKKCTEL